MSEKLWLNGLVGNAPVPGQRFDTEDAAHQALRVKLMDAGTRHYCVGAADAEGATYWRVINVNGDIAEWWWVGEDETHPPVAMLQRLVDGLG